MKKFELGNLYITPGAMETMEKLGIDVIEILGRHQGGDWSEMDKEDIQANNDALEDGSRIFSSYSAKGYLDVSDNRPCSSRDTDGVKFWVITEADRSATTILLPSEY